MWGGGVWRTGERERQLIARGRKSIILLEGSQALPVRPSHECRMRAKTLER